jgi:hypothetical protein
MNSREAIEEVLRRAGQPLRAAAIAKAINDERLYVRGDGDPLPAYQVYSTAHGYPGVFEIDSGLIALRSEDQREPGESEPEDDAEPTRLPAVRTEKGRKIMTGIAGEHFVAGELSRQGWIVGLTAKNTASVDVLAKREHSSRTLSLQVKSRTNAYPYAWRVGQKPEERDCDFYVLVDLREVGEVPLYFVVPTKEVIRLWSNEQIRTRDVEVFREKWDLLEAEADR